MRKRSMSEIGHDGVWMQPVGEAAPYAGAYVIGECWIWLGRRPAWLHRHLVEWCFGWRWVDVPAAPRVRAVVPSTSAGGGGR